MVAGFPCNYKSFLQLPNYMRLLAANVEMPFREAQHRTIFINRFQNTVALGHHKTYGIGPPLCSAVSS